MKIAALSLVVVLLFSLGVSLASSVGRGAQREILTSTPEKPSDSRLIQTYHFSHRVNRMHGDGEYLYYTDGVPYRLGKTYRVNRETGDEELFFDYGGDMVYAEGDHVYIGNSHGLRTHIWKIDKSTREVVWSWEGYGSENVYDNEDGVSDGNSCYGYGVGKYGVYGRGALHGNSYIRKEDGSVKWTSDGITRYPDLVLPDLKDEFVVETGLWSPNTIQRVSKADGRVIWRRRGPTADMGEVTHPVDITDDAIWVQVYRGTYPDQYPYALAKWSRETGETLAIYPELPYQKIWHLGPEGSLIFDYPDEMEKALAWDADHETLNKVDSTTWEVYWTTDLGYPVGYAPERPYIDGPFIYLGDPEDPTVIYQYRWREVADTTPPSSSVDPIEPYWVQRLAIDSIIFPFPPFIVRASVSYDPSGVESVELYYRYSRDNSWDGVGWELYGVDSDGSDGWSWWFIFPEGYGYYEFYSIAMDRAGNVEEAPVVADASCRVAKELLRVAVIFAEPNDVEHELVSPWRDREFFQWVARVFQGYFDEASYGATAVIIEFFDNSEDWYKLGKGWREYIEEREEDNRWKHEFVNEAINLVRGHLGGAFNYDIYKAIIVVGAPPAEIEYLRSYAFDKRIAADIWDYWYVWAHETGHTLGLPDLYGGGDPWSRESWGEVDNWGMMASGAWRGVHFSSWSKEQLGWLTYRDVEWGDFQIKALPTMNYGEQVLHRHLDSYFGDTWGYLEVRTPLFNYGHFDVGVPIPFPRHSGGFVLYEVYYPWIAPHPTVNVVRMNPDDDRDYLWVGETYQNPPTRWFGDRVQFTVLSASEGTDTYEMQVRLSSYGSPENLVGMYLYPTVWELEVLGGPSSTEPPLEAVVSPDLDLHAYTFDGRHIGVNYETGEYEVEIPEALVSYDRETGREWIFVPDNVEVYFVVSGRDVKEFVETFPTIEASDNGQYGLRGVRVDNNGEVYEALSDVQVINVGSEIFNGLNVVQNPDGTYSVEVADGMDLFSLEAWHTAIDNVSDDAFINQSVNRKQALKNKFRAIFNMIGVNNYAGAIEKLTNDILKKLDADDNADWVREPVLVDELRAFIGFLKHKSGVVD